jgi:hydroxymethylpyrimidine pyrophosphatase-like HAD family hydrolase
MSRYKGVIFSDVDGTLAFHENLHKIKLQRKNTDGTVTVTDTNSECDYDAYHVPTPLYNVFVGVRTHKLGHALAKGHEFVCVTGARRRSMDGRRQALDFATCFILENGGIILDGEYRRDNEWADYLSGELSCLKEIKSFLKSRGWNLDIKGRKASIRVRKKDNTHKSPEQFESLEKSLELPRELKKTRNLGNLDIIPQSAGKGNAIDYLMQKMRYTLSESYGIGDDTNDVPLLYRTGTRFVLGSGHPAVIANAQEEGWYVSKGLHFDGINEILEQILNLSKPPQEPLQRKH